MIHVPCFSSQITGNKVMSFSWLFTKYFINIARFGKGLSYEKKKKVCQKIYSITANIPQLKDRMQNYSMQASFAGV